MACKKPEDQTRISLTVSSLQDAGFSVQELIARHDGVDFIVEGIDDGVPSELIADLVDHFRLTDVEAKIVAAHIEKELFNAVDGCRFARAIRIEG